ncbi:baseplate multidomain protein megatron [Qingshengfaniella alkalisoli]|uniref:Host specificity protein n=1 Tax=Qingshengfaniella alkalisoli TaxID=2599296 RepID=A0A5B8I685_9RHOB|nr:glycoside hydrolase TIM-barrel-like domain-containing protein [Qingshengfaniella alkalisoli]QDY68929.1 host specificity protein [Qingshengfaniella alkalisoli]
MATLVLSAAGSALGGTIGGSLLGASAAVLGRAVGASLGHAIDQRLLGVGSDAVETGKVDRFRLMGASEGASVAKLYGRNRLAGQVIWASNFLEHNSTETAGGGKAGGATVRSYSYSISLAIALCEGEISGIGRVWADGQEIDRDSLNMRVYPGTEDQLPDDVVAAIEGSEYAPSYRGTAYVVLEDLNLASFGNRVPQFTFEVSSLSPAVEGSPPSLVDSIKGVALIPGTGEYALGTTPVRYKDGPGSARIANEHSSLGKTDLPASLDALEAQLPNCRSVSLVVSWFGDDLRCGQCSLAPKVEQNEIDGEGSPWTVAGLDRARAGRVPVQDGRPVYGGTPSDQSVVEAIREIRQREQSVMFYPFILLTQQSDNGLPDPWGNGDQPAMPWRGRITASVAPNREGTPDKTSGVLNEVRSFFGLADVTDFAVSEGAVTYSGPLEWGYRRMILHYAALCAAAGGVEAFCIGSEMRSLTQLRGEGNTFPVVEELVRLAEDVRQILGAETKIGYAADWSEYFGYTPVDGRGDHFFHLDPLWASDDIDFVGIDNYMPLSDWRDGADHSDIAWGSIYSLDYLKSNIAGGEGFDWYYASSQAFDEQIRTPITDGAYGEPWIYRYKDIRSWWSNAHHNRIQGVRETESTAWQPGLKPIWFTEIGCAAIDKGTNEPNKFVDPKSSESSLPRGSNGARDDLIQMQYLRAIEEYWSDAENNPEATHYAGRMVDISKSHVWAWDARPYPWFPGLTHVWSDGENYVRGHWLNGRAPAQPLSTVVADLCRHGGLRPDQYDVSQLFGLVRGYSIPAGMSVRAMLQPLMTTYGFDAYERNGKLLFKNRSVLSEATDASELLVDHPDLGQDISVTRVSDGGQVSEVQFTAIEADGSYAPFVTSSAVPQEQGWSVSRSEANLVLTSADARRTTDRWIEECSAARETIRFAVPPSQLAIGPGDIVRAADSLWRVDSSELTESNLLEAVRVTGRLYHPMAVEEETGTLLKFPVAQRPDVVIMDLPALAAEANPVAPYLAVAARPGAGDVAFFSGKDEHSFELETVVHTSAAIGRTLTPLQKAKASLFDRGEDLIIEIAGRELSSATLERVFAGENMLAISDGVGGDWELLQFCEVELIAQNRYALRKRLRGQLGTESCIADCWPAGSVVVVIDRALFQPLADSQALGSTRHFRIGPSTKPITDWRYVQLEHDFVGRGLKPYSPVHLSSQNLVSGDHRISWVRRSRLHGDLWHLSAIPLDEARERYLLRVLHTNEVRREIETDSPYWLYKQSERQADGVANMYTIEVAQISELYGVGDFGRIEINE